MNLKEKMLNSGGKIYYGMHFYPGVAQYDEPGKQSKMVFVNENTIRKLDPTFQGKPIFVEHVEEVETNVDELRKEADGWVIESFFNSADGKHWVKFIAVSKHAERAIERGFRLSNAYIPQLNGQGGQWNGVTYQEEVVGGEYEHLAIVQNPRYEESVIMTPDEFKAYNEGLQIELKRIANSKTEKEITAMSKLKFWNRKPAENAADLESLEVTLPKTGKTMSVLSIVNAMDEMEEKKKENMADPKAMVKMHDGAMCNVGELVEKHKAMYDELEGMKKSNEDGDEPEMENTEEKEGDLVPEEEPLDVEGDLHNEDEIPGEEKEVPKKKENEEAKPAKDAKDPKMANAKAKADVAKKRKEHFEALKNAPLKNQKNEQTFQSLADGVARGKAKYGSH